MYIWDSCKLVSRESEAGAQSRKRHIAMDAVCSNLTLSSASLWIDVCPAKSEKPVPESNTRSIWNTEKVMTVRANTSGEISNVGNVQPTNVDTAVWRTCATDDRTEKSVLIRKFSCDIYKPILIVTNLSRITEMPNLLREELEEHT